MMRAGAGGTPRSRISAYLARPRCKGTGAERAKQKIISALSARPAPPRPPRPARPRSQKGIVGPPWPPPEPSGAEARAVLLLGPDRAGPRTSRPRLRAAVGAVPGPGACRGTRFREVWLTGSRNGAWEAEECGGFRFLPYVCFRRSPGPGVRPLLWA